MTEEIRTVSSTGGEKSTKPERFSLIPKAPLDLLGKVYDFGTRKYAPHNYRKGYEWSKSYDALQRHLTAWWEMDETDEESGLSHLGHAAWHIFALIVFSSEERYAQFDDRYKGYMLTREEAYGPEGAAVINKLLGPEYEDFDLNISKHLITDTPWPRLSQDEPGLILVTPEEFDHMCPSFLDEKSTVKEVDAHVQAGRITSNQAEAWARRYHDKKNKSRECVWFETITPDGAAWVCRHHDGLTRWAPKNGDLCDGVKSKSINEHAICYYSDASRADSYVCLEHGYTSKYGTNEGPNRACQAVDPWTLDGLMEQTEGMSTTVNQDRFVPSGKEISDAIRNATVSKKNVTLLPEDERPFIHPNGEKIACDYKFVTGPGHSMTTGYYLCKVHESKTERHPSEGANRPCNYIDPTNGDWGTVIPPAVGN